MWLRLLKMPTQNSLRFLLLLMSMLGNILTTVGADCDKAKFLIRLWAQGLVKILKLRFRRYFEAEVWSVLCCWSLVEVIWNWILVEILKLGMVKILKFKFSRDGDVWLRFWSKCLVEILKMKFDQDLCLNLWYDPILYFGKMNSTLGSVVLLAMFGQ